MKDPLRVTIPIDSIWRHLAKTAVVLWVLSLFFHGIYILTGHNNIFGLAPFLTLENERNLPTFFTALLMLVAAMGLLLIATLEKNKRCWAWLSLLFVYLAMDELVMIHESWGLFISFFKIPSNALLTFAWIYPGLLLVMVTWIFFRKSLACLPAETSRRFLLAGVVYLGGAIGIEFVTGLYGSIKNLRYSDLANTGPYLI